MTEPTPTIRAIQEHVAAACRVSMRELLSPRRRADLVRARSLAYWIAYELTPASTPVIGRAFGDRDHTTIIHGLRKVRGDAALRAEAERLAQAIREDRPCSAS